MHHRQPQTTNKPNVAGAVLLAAAVGTVAGLLFAPKKGTETRSDLKQKYNGMKNKTQDAAENAKDSVNQKVEQTRNKVHDAIDKTKNSSDKVADKAKDATDKVARDAQEASKQAADRTNRDRPAM